jgi:2-polyprenyl-3-methyl-5-hydroxy-6-metoxy-1,4-benzoquinol methylase
VKTWSMPVSAGKSKTRPCALCGSLIFKTALVCEGFSFVKCKHCGLVQRNPQPDKNEILARYSSTYGNDYLSYELENETAFLKLQQLALKDAGFSKLEKILFAAKQPRADSAPLILDIGCATGALLAVLRDKGWRVTGVEISPSAIYAKNERKLDVRNVPLEENNFPDSSFDVILASHLIEHLNEPKTFLEETYRILKDNGSIFITTPDISGFQSRLFGSRWRSAIFDHLYLFSRRTLSKMLKTVGFKVISCHSWGGLAAGAAPKTVKRVADFLAKRLNFGDVMIIRAKKFTTNHTKE